MTEPMGVNGYEDIERDLEGTRRRAEWVERYATDARAAGDGRNLEVRRRPRGDGATAAPTAGPSGEQLVSRRPAELRVRYRTLLHLEAQFGIDYDFGCLIASACQVLESELFRLLTEPARPFADDLVRVLAGADKARPAELLAAWSAGKFPATIGTASLVLLALRCGLAAGDGASREFLARHFRPGYAELVARKEFGAALDRIRETYRNPACHATRTFPRDDYEQFARLAVARRRFAAWAASGPGPDEAPEASGLLHRHLTESLLVPAAGDAEPTSAERLVELARPRESLLRIRVGPRPAGACSDPIDRVGADNDRMNAVTTSAGPPRLARPFRLGEPLAFAFRAEQDCNVTLIDVGTSGAVTVLLPNACQPRTAVTAGRVGWLPDPVASDFDVVPTGPPGRERLVALAWRGDPPVDLRPQGDDLFRQLTAREVDDFCAAVRRTDPGGWAACVAEFDIVT